MSYFQHTLANGLRIILEQTTSKVAYCGYAINVGTRDELPSEAGMAHLVEHMIFKGTSHRKSWHILNRMENVGGDLNAYTSREETMVYSTFLVEHFSRAVDLLTDIVFHSIYPEEELIKEIDVIVDEIQSYKDSPSELIFDEFDTILFKDHPLGRDILGDVRSLKSHSSKAIQEFTSRHYHPDNMVFFVRGNLSFKRVINTLERFTDSLTGQNGRVDRIAPPLQKPIKRVVQKETHQTHVLMGARGYSFFEEKRDALFLLNNILGGPGMNSRLNLSLRERYGLVYAVESNLTSYTDAGQLSIYFGCDAKDLNNCLELVLRELNELRQTRLSSLKLSMAKKQLLGQIGVSSDHGESMALGMGKTFLHLNKCDDYNAIYQRITGLTELDILEVANEVLSEEKLFYLIYSARSES